MMLIVTGGIACGKSTFLEVARELCDGIIIDADEWYHNLVSGQEADKRLTSMLFGKMSVKTAAFRHINWPIYEKAIADMFCVYVGMIQPDICVIPEYFKREDYFDARLGRWNPIITIERIDNVDAAVQRDSHRSPAQTQRIADNQSTHDIRVARSDYVLYNEGSKDEFRQECIKWLELHSPEVFTLRMKVTAT